MDKDIQRRLSAISHNTQLGSGFNIAMEDLEIRGAGNLLGIEQHGFIMAVGFDLYCRLLREAISNFKKAGVLNETNH
jgi:transcription-repair coupling factor (superfamily II helicase)